MKINLVTGAFALALGACAYEPAPLPAVASQLSAADPAISSPDGYRAPLAGFEQRGPTGPRDWRSVNREQSEGN